MTSSQHISRASFSQFSRFLPASVWMKSYTREDLNGDVFAGIITAILLVPQGIAYAMLAGLPPQLGLYASILPPAIYALLGTSRTLSVGPVSIAAIMIASALTAPEIITLENPAESAVILAAECGLILLVMASLRMGGLVNFISHPVLTGFTSGASLLIITSQIPKLLGLTKPQCSLNMACYLNYIEGSNPVTLLLGLFAILLLLFFGRPLIFLLKRTKLSTSFVTGISKCGPLLTVALTTFMVTYFNLVEYRNIEIVGRVPAGLPDFSLDFISSKKWKILLPYAGFIALISYVESVAIAKVTANLRSQKISPNQELIALGTANMAASVSGGMPVAGGFSRTMVNFSAGARTQMAMLIAAGILALTVIFLSESFENIPKAALASIIIIAILPLVRLQSIINTWRYDRGDGAAEMITLLGVLILGIEEGLALGIVLTIFSFLRKTSRPHIAVVGRIPETEHFRNINRHQVETWNHLLLLRVDENISFTNVSYIEDFVLSELGKRQDIRHIVLILASVSDIDTTALESLTNLNRTVQKNDITLHLAEVKGPVMDKLVQTDFLDEIKPGKVFFRTDEAAVELGNLEKSVFV